MTVFGEYTLQGELNSQRRGIVKSSSGQVLSIRLIPLLDSSAEEIERETILLRSLSHPNILRVHECFIWEQYLAIVEKYASKFSYEDYEGDEYKIAVEVTSGLLYLHDTKHIMHGNITTEDIYLDANGTSMLGGMSRLQHTADDPDSVYSTAPERLDGRYGFASDIWQLGVVFLKLCLGKRFNKEPHSSSVELQSLVCDISDNILRQLIEKMLDSEMNHRPTVSKVFSILKQTDEKQEDQQSSDKRLLNQHMDLYDQYTHKKISGSKLRPVEVGNFERIRCLADKEYPIALFLMGRMLSMGIGCTEDRVQGKVMFKKALDLGIYQSLYSLSVLEKDQELSKAYLEKGAELGDETCLQALGREYAKGNRGFEKSYVKALGLFGRTSLPCAKYQLTKLFSGQRGYQSYFDRRMVDIYKVAADSGYKKAVEALGRCNEDKDENRKAVLYYLVASKMEGNYISKCSQLQKHVGRCALEFQNRLSAQYWIGRAKDHGNEWAKVKFLNEHFFDSRA